MIKFIIGFYNAIFNIILNNFLGLQLVNQKNINLIKIIFEILFSAWLGNGLRTTLIYYYLKLTTLQSLLWHNF